MTDDDIVIIGLPSKGLQELADRLFIQQLDDTGLRRACSNTNEPHTSGPMTGRLKACFPQGKLSNALVIYQTPWGFLERQARKAASGADSYEQLKSSARAALGFWHAYHVSLLGLHREHRHRCLLINGDRTFEVAAVTALAEERFGLRLRVKQHPSLRETAAIPAQHDAVWRGIAEILAPESADLYIEMESCAELLGRSPEFDLGRFASPEALMVDLLQLMNHQGRIAGALARHGISLDDAEAQLDALKKEKELYLLQVHQIQDELKNYFELNRQKEQQLEQLQQRLKSQSAPVLARIARKMLGRKPTAPAPGSGDAQGQAESSSQQRRDEKHVLPEQVETIRASGLFDEKWYLGTYPDVAQDGQDPIKHYLRFGAAEGRNPSAHFDSRWYLEAYADVAAARLNPLLHYIQHGKGEGRQPLRSPGRAKRHAGPVR